MKNIHDIEARVMMAYPIPSNMMEMLDAIEVMYKDVIAYLEEVGGYDGSARALSKGLCKAVKHCSETWIAWASKTVAVDRYKYSNLSYSAQELICVIGAITREHNEKHHNEVIIAQPTSGNRFYYDLGMGMRESEDLEYNIKQLELRLKLIELCKMKIQN